MADLKEMFAEVREEIQALGWEGSFEEYVDRVIANPTLARLAHSRIYDMIQWFGVTTNSSGIPEHRLFSNDLYGLDLGLGRVVQYFHTASRGLEVKKRILLLLGPPGSGKSTVVGLIKEGLERYSRTNEGAIYAIKGCPMQEDPLHLVPEKWRETLISEYNIKVEGDLCPRCRYNLIHECNGDISKVKIKRILLSESAGIGIGTFVASTHENQDMARLVGSLDLSRMGDDRQDGSGRGFRLDGELEAGNRGIVEFAQIFKSDDRFLTILLGVTQEQQIKLGSFGSVYADEVIIAVSNEQEYREFIKNKQTEALLDRLIVVNIPYNLGITAEIRIYQKLLGADITEGIHIAPTTLQLAALFSVLSRLDQSRRFSGLSRISLVEKAYLYDGQFPGDYDESDVEMLKEDVPNEGMFGLSTRYVINRLAHAMTESSDCLRPLVAFQSLIEGIDERAGLCKEEQEKVISLVPDVIKEYMQVIVRELKKASMDTYDQLASQLFDTYVKNLEIYQKTLQTRNSWDLKDESLDEMVMQRIENSLNVRDMQRPHFRQHIYQLHKTIQSQVHSPGPNSIPQLRMAIENTLLPTTNDLKLMLFGNSQGGRANNQPLTDIHIRLTSLMGYCDECAEDLLSLGMQFLKGKLSIQVRRGRLHW